MKNYKQLLLLVIVVNSLGCDEAKKIKLNLEKTPEKIALFGNGIISTSLYERDIAISPSGEEIIYTLGDYKQTKRCLVKIEKIKGKWTGPKILNISGEYQDIEPFFSLDGNGLYFASNRPQNKNSSRKDYNIWYCERDGENWKAPTAMGGNINTENDEFYPSVSRNGNLYFTSIRENGMGKEDIFLSRKVDGVYTEAIALDSTVNTKHYEFNAFISPDENLLIFSSFGRPDDIGGGDLYYSQKGKDGKWEEARNFGKIVNSDKLDYCPFIDIERSNFYFTSERVKSGVNKITEVEELINYSNDPENGMGNIYRIGMEQLKLNAE